MAADAKRVDVPRTSRHTTHSARRPASPLPSTTLTVLVVGRLLCRRGELARGLSSECVLVGCQNLRPGHSPSATTVQEGEDDRGLLRHCHCQWSVRTAAVLAFRTGTWTG